MLRIFLLVILLIFSSKASTLKDAEELLKQGDIKKALETYKLVARSGDSEAAFKLGVIYFKGKVVRKDLNKAMKYFKRAAARDHKKAKYNQAIIYANKRYKNHNFKKAYNIFHELANNGDPKAQNKLGIFLTYGFGIDKDYKKAVEWLEKSYFKSKYLPASCNLAFMFADGRGVFPNFGRANVLAKKGYEKGLPMCVKVYKEYKLYKYTQDKGFKYGYYKELPSN